MDAPDALSSAAAGMRLQSDRLDLIAQNLANASTIGYRERAASAFGDALGSAVAQGALRRTGVRTDVALVGQGFLCVVTPDGIRYTRDGRLSITTDNSLADARGNPVLGALGAARYPRGAHVEPDGRIVADGRVVDTLRVVTFSTDGARMDGPYLATARGVVPTKSTSTTVHAGYLEESTVDPIAEMTSLVDAQRAFEANQKTAQRADESLRRAVTDVPAVRS